ncbi:MAG TPA: Stk1 family PASTA domain-containing Ser/Thr kinase [Jatrophihabitantaceae bacterium]|jgi:serine/threonine-protein kinase
MTQHRLVGGRYELGELIGYGGMAEVHRGRDIRLGRDVAIKVLRADLARDPSFLNRFRREAQAAAGLNHASIVSVYDTGEDAGVEGTPQPFIVMEYVQGRTLRDILKTEGKLPPRRAMEIVAEVAGALDFSHRSGLVHRDVKPANVMITQTGAVKVMDFGIARAVADNAATVTQTANVIGTAQYLSPEQARGEAVDARSDVYSTGCLLYELVTGTPPFQGDSPVAVAYQHVRENASAPSSRVPGLPRALDSIVMKALAKNPQNRYQSAGEMRTDLQRALANQPVSAEAVMTDAERTQFIARTPPPPVPVPPPGAAEEPEKDRHTAVIWTAIVVALLLVIGAAAFFIWKLGDSNNETPKVTMPNLVGLTVSQANATLGNPANCDTNCNVVLQADQNTPTTAGPCDDGSTPKTDGVICKLLQGDTTVSAGTQVSKGSTVVYELYKKAVVNVPYVIGSSFGDAQKALQNAKLTPKQGKNVNTFDQPKGVVVAQHPDANTPVSPGQPVTLDVSTGKVKLPDVTGMKAAEAKSKLNGMGFNHVDNTSKTKTTHDKGKDGTVYAEDPTSGIAYGPDVQITLTIYKYTAPPPTCDPNKTATPPASTTPPATGAPTTTPTPTPTSTNTLPPCK